MPENSGKPIMKPLNFTLFGLDDFPSQKSNLISARTIIRSGLLSSTCVSSIFSTDREKDYITEGEVLD